MSKPLPLLDSPKRRLTRANQHIRRLEKRIATFFKKKPGGSFSETDSEGFTTHGYRFTRNIPDSWADDGAEAIEALRSSLDQCGYAVAVKAGITDPRNAYFPFGDSIADLDGVTKGRCKDLPPEISALFRSFNAHEGGNYALWALNKLCNANKHRLLVPVGIASGGLMMKRATLMGGSIPSPIFDREKNQMVIAKINPGGHFEYDAQLSFLVAFDDINGVNGRPCGWHPRCHRGRS